MKPDTDGAAHELDQAADALARVASEARGDVATVALVRGIEDAAMALGRAAAALRGASRTSSSSSSSKRLARRCRAARR